VDILWRSWLGRSWLLASVTILTILGILTASFPRSQSTAYSQFPASSTTSSLRSQ
jgi:cytochrome bd-type quinol oxidase subunit 2